MTLEVEFEALTSVLFTEATDVVFWVEMVFYVLITGAGFGGETVLLGGDGTLFGATFVAFTYA